MVDLATVIPVRFLPPGRKFEAEIPDEFFWLSRSTDTTTGHEQTDYPWKLAAMVSAGVVAATLVEFQWKVSVTMVEREKDLRIRY